ncbi:MAG: hypothetical protein IKM53_02690 [Clostridia bacterium]|nr:hypothetical protein [Clostridia bacterium]
MADKKNSKDQKKPTATAKLPKAMEYEGEFCDICGDSGIPLVDVIMDRQHIKVCEDCLNTSFALYKPLTIRISANPRRRQRTPS